MRHCEAGIDGNRLADQSDPGFAIVFLIAQASREMQGIAMGRIQGQDLLVTQRRDVELARLVMLDRALQDLFKVVRHGFILRKRFHLAQQKCCYASNIRKRILL